MLPKNVVAPKKMGRTRKSGGHHKLWSLLPDSLVAATKIFGRASLLRMFAYLSTVNLKDDAIVYHCHLGLNELLTAKALTSKAI